MTEVAAEPTTYQLFIAGRWVSGVTGETFEMRQPGRHARGRRAVPGRAPPADVAMAIRAAEMATPGWKATPAPKRGEILYRFGALMAEHKERLARAMTREMGKVLAEARGDVQEGIDIAFLMAGEGRRLFGDTVPVGAARQVGDVDPPAAGDRGDRHALELPDGDPVLEDDARARRRQHGRVQAQLATRRCARRSSSS